MKTISLVMIVKNESKVIKRCLDSIKGIIDYWVIVDTGSTDNTIEIIRKELKDIPGELHKSKWINFGYNRTEAINFAYNKADYLLLMDADLVAIVNNLDKNKLNKDFYYIRIMDNLSYVNKCLVNGHLNWEYTGVTHECIDSKEAKTYEELKEIKLKDYCDGGNRKTKFVRDIDLLEQGIKNEPNNTRYMFYLGQSYKDIGNYKRAIEWYQKRAKARGWGEEVFYSEYQIGLLSKKLGDYGRAFGHYLKAYEVRPTRAESLYALACMLRTQGYYNQAYLFIKKALEIKKPKDILFVDNDIYRYWIPFEFSICAYWVKEYYKSVEMCDKITQIPNVPENTQIQNIKNKQFAMGKINEKTPTLKLEFNKTEAIENLKDIKKVFDALGIKWAIIGGTLLGCIREQDFLKHDTDMDITVKIEDYTSNIEKVFINNGFNHVATFGSVEKGLELRFIKRGIQIDIIFLYDEGKQSWLGVWDNEGSLIKAMFNKFDIDKTTNFLGVEVGIPNNPIKYLETSFGKNWKIPVKNWIWNKSAKNFRKEK